MHHRLAAALRIMRKHRCTHLLVTDTVDVEYLSAFRASRAVLLIGATGNFLCTDSRYGESAERFCAKNRAWKFVLIKENDFSFLSPLVPLSAVVGFQADVVSVDELAALKKAVRRARFVPVPREISGISIAKTAFELCSMRKAARTGDRAFGRFLAALRPGITEREAARTLDRLCSESGSEKPSFDTIVLFGKRTSLPHGSPGRRKLKKGDFVLVDFGCTVNGLCSDMTRTVVCGAPTARRRALYGVVRAAQAAARRAARPGMAASALDAAARTVIAKAGFGEAFGHGLGHGVGRRIHEAPRVSSKSKEILKEGSVITIEPGIYLPGVGGVRIEDMVVLTRNGARLLTHSSRKLLEL
jgi:Xaa-Pro aminopeptidase